MAITQTHGKKPKDLQRMPARGGISEGIGSGLRFRRTAIRSYEASYHERRCGFGVRQPPQQNLSRLRELARGLGISNLKKRHSDSTPTAFLQQLLGRHAKPNTHK